MSTLRSQLAAMPLVARFAVVCSTSALVVGGLVGLVLGLIAYPATAWFAIVEVGIPAGVLGALGGLLVGGAVVAVRKITHHR